MTYPIKQNCINDSLSDKSNGKEVEQEVEQEVDTDHDAVSSSSDTESGSDDESDYENKSAITMLGLNITEKAETDLYLIVKDGVTQGYVSDISIARQYMWSFARAYRSKWYEGYVTYIREGANPNKIQISGYSRFFIFFLYESIFSTFEVYKTSEIIQNDDKDKDEDKDEDKDKDEFFKTSGLCNGEGNGCSNGKKSGWLW